MNTAVINIKTEPQVKKQAQKVAAELGLTLSSLVNGFLKQVIHTKTVTFSLPKEEPTEYMLKALKESAADIKAGRVTHFATIDDAVSHFEQLLVKDEKRK